MLSQAFSLSLTSFIAIFLPVFAIGGDAAYAARCGAILASATLLLSGWTQAKLNIDLASARVERARSWNVPSTVIDQPTPQIAGNWPLPAFQASPPTENIRLIPVRHNSTTFASTAPPVTRRLIENVDAADLAAFVSGLSERGLARRHWLGVAMPSGRKVDSDYHQALIVPLVRIGAIVNRTPRVSGRVVMTPAAIRQLLGLAS